MAFAEVDHGVRIHVQDLGNPLDGYHIDRLAADVITALNRLEIGSATVVGYSCGGGLPFAPRRSHPN